MPRTTSKPDISAAKRVAVAIFVADQSVGGRLVHGAIKVAMEKFSLSRRAVHAIAKMRGEPKALVAVPRTGYNQRGRQLSVQEVGERVAVVPLCKRQTLRSLAEATGIPRSTLHRHLQDTTLRRVISRVKPALTDGHKTRRLAFALAQVQRPIGGRVYRFDAMFNVVHIDEKWFNMYKASTRYYLTAEENLPYRSCPNKRYIGKVMFLAAVARPRYDFGRRQRFDGKIGIWPIIERTKAIRDSVNRPAGTPISKSVSMTRTVYVRMLKEKVFPAIRAKWPGGKTRTIFVQQDNAGPHVDEGHGEIVAAGKEGGWKIMMRCQPPRSPDCNILDLGFFNAIQSLQYRNPTNQIDKLIEAVEEAYKNTKDTTLDKCFLTLQKVMERIIEHAGGNDFRIPRVRKISYRDGVAPMSLSICENTFKSGSKALSQQSLD